MKYPIWMYVRDGEMWRAISNRNDATAEAAYFFDLVLMIVRLENNEPFELIAKS